MADKEKEKKKRPKSSSYNTTGAKLVRKSKACPKCGAGVFLAEHKDRFHCGKCQYMQKK